MSLKRTLTLVPPTLLLGAGTAFAAGAGFPGEGALTTVQGWLTGGIAEFLGVTAIVGLGALIWLAHEYGHMFMYVFRAILGIAFVVFAVTIYTTAFGAGATITPPKVSESSR